MRIVLIPMAVAAVSAASCARPPAASPDGRPLPALAPARGDAGPTPVEAGGRLTRVVERADRDAAPALDVSEGEATYYAAKFEGRRTASGVVFSNEEPYAAHRTYPFGTIVRVTNRSNDRSIVLRVVDRGPFGRSARARRTIIDVSQSAARELDFIRAGRIPVRVEVLEWGSGSR